MRVTGIAATLVAAFGLSACGTLTSFLDNFNNTDPPPAPVSTASEEAATVGQVVYVDRVVDIRMDNGDLRTVIQPSLGEVRLGDRVRLADGRVYRY